MPRAGSRTNNISVARMNRFQYEIGTNGQPSQAAANVLFPERPAGYNVPRTSIPTLLGASLAPSRGRQIIIARCLHRS